MIEQPATPLLDVVKVIDDYLLQQISKYPINANNASVMGHECTRYLVYRRTRWQDSTSFSLASKKKMEDGNVHEEAIIKLMQAAGIKVIQQQQYFKWEQYNITGKKDGSIEDPFTRKSAPFEIKSMDTFFFQKINGPEDFYQDNFLKKYLAQLNLYMLMENKEHGFFILKDRNSTELKQINIRLDYALGEACLQKAEQTNKHVKEGTLPERIPYCRSCKFCEYRNICLERMNFNNMAEVIEDQALEDMLERRTEIEPIYKEYGRLDKKLKEQFKEKPLVIIGPYQVTGEWRERKGFTAEPSKFWVTEIDRL